MVYDGMKTSGQLHAPATFPLGEETPNTYGIEDWVGPRSSDRNTLYSLIKHQILKLWFTDNIKVKQSRYRPGVVQRVPGS
jgi:hypothetical protein